jgi:hypothetical protein
MGKNCTQDFILDKNNDFRALKIKIDAWNLHLPKVR